MGLCLTLYLMLLLILVDNSVLELVQSVDLRGEWQQEEDLQLPGHEEQRQDQPTPEISGRILRAGKVSWNLQNNSISLTLFYW